jgi:hypothetical protein
VTQRAPTAALALLVLLAACSEAGPTVPSEAVRFDPPARFRALWTVTEHCAGARRPFAAVRWYQVPDAWEVTTGDGQRVAGYYDLAADHVVIAGAYLASEPLIRHEALHAILDRHGHGAEFDACNLRLTE